MTWTEQNQTRALELYTLNTRLSESLYVALQILEVALRNRIDTVMAKKFGQGWLQDDNALLIDRQKDQREGAVRELKGARKEASNGRLVAALPFSFWTSMFNSEYETLWQQGLHKIGRKQDGKGLVRKDVSKKLTPIRILRNRVAHHEPILHWNLSKHHENMIQLCEWFSPEAAQWCRKHCRFAEIYPEGGITLVRPGA